jgi:hypothetical protein
MARMSRAITFSMMSAQVAAPYDKQYARRRVKLPVPALENLDLPDAGDGHDGGLSPGAPLSVR